MVNGPAEAGNPVEAGNSVEAANPAEPANRDAGSGSARERDPGDGDGAGGGGSGGGHGDGSSGDGAAPARRRPELTPDAVRTLNFLGLLGMLGVLVSAYLYQFTTRQLPCTLCLMQRVAMLGVCLGAAMNLKFGPRPRHYAICVLSAVFGLSVSARQTLLHINPYFDTTTARPTLDATTNPPFGSPVLGLHLYVWGLVVFTLTLLAVGVVMLSSSQFRDRGTKEPGWLSNMVKVGVVLLVVVSSAEVLSTFAECGPHACPDDGAWDWWLF